MIFTVVGGDMRSARLAELLAAEGNECRVFALDKLNVDTAVTSCSDIRSAAENTDCVILPLPVSLKEGFLNAPLSDTAHLLPGIFAALPKSAVVCGGRVDEKTAEAVKAAGLTIEDYSEREEFTVANAAATAEGALQILMEELPVTIAGTKCLVVGFGRIGKLLAIKLSVLGADVTVSARSCGDMAWIRALGLKAADTRRLKGTLGDYSVIVNTVPARILDRETLHGVNRECLCLDLASKPGGIDLNAAADLKLKTIWALGLPGETAPAASGAAMNEAVKNILRERGRL